MKKWWHLLFFLLGISWCTTQVISLWVKILSFHPEDRFSKVPVTFRAQNQIFKSKYKRKRLQVLALLDYKSSPHFFLSDSRVSEMRAQMKITPHEKRQHVVGRVKNEGLQTKPHFSLSPPCVAFSRVGDFHAHSRLACSTIPEEKWGLPVV